MSKDSNKTTDTAMSPLIKKVLISSALFVAVFGLLFGGYYLITTPQRDGAQKEEPTDSSGQSGQKKMIYPEETIIEETEQENVYKVNPSEEDTLFIEDSEGNLIPIPSPEATKKLREEQ